MRGEFDGKVALITGGSRGIGRETARMLGKQGATVVLAARDADQVGGVAFELAAAGVAAEGVTADVTSAEDVDRLVRGIDRRYGRIDLCVHAAGAGLLKPALDITEDDFDYTIETNLKGSFLVLQRVAKSMTGTGGGTIVAIPGVLGKAPMAMGAAYCASKYGLTGLVKAMAIDLKRANVRFSLMFLGGVNTSFWEAEGIAMKVQRDKMLAPDTAARACLFAASQAMPGIVAEIVIQPENHQVL